MNFLDQRKSDAKSGYRKFIHASLALALTVAKKSLLGSEYLYMWGVVVAVSQWVNLVFDLAFFVYGLYTIMNFRILSLADMDGN